MNDLTEYAARFQELFPRYSDACYEAILTLVNQYAQQNVMATVRGQPFIQLVELLRPLVAIKNYKSQVPFPEALKEVLECFIRVKQCDPASEGEIDELFKQLIRMQGFQLPTVSAVFHFCHPDTFPIVDENVEAACETLAKEYCDDFKHFTVPKRPGPTTSEANKRNKYREFNDFIDWVMLLQSEHTDNVSYRFVDKALMVIGRYGL